MTLFVDSPRCIQCVGEVTMCLSFTEKRLLLHKKRKSIGVVIKRRIIHFVTSSMVI